MPTGSETAGGRALTIKDRFPEPGDVLYCTLPSFRPWKEYTVVGFRDVRGDSSPMVRVPRYMPIITIVKPLWGVFAYRSRKDGGPVTAEQSPPALPAAGETGEGGAE